MVQQEEWCWHIVLATTDGCWVPFAQTILQNYCAKCALSFKKWIKKNLAQELRKLTGKSSDLPRLLAGQRSVVADR